MSTPLREVQLQMGRWLRDPHGNAPPANIEPRRLRVYQELVYNNIEGFIRGGFPVLHSLYPKDDWHALVAAFCREHRCHSPYFLEISQEFLRFLMETYEPQAADPPFLAELAHYEWLELALDISEEEIPRQGVDPDGDLLLGVPVVSPLVMAAAYQYPVHRIGPGWQPEAPGEQPTCLLVYRNQADAVKFMEVNAATLTLLDVLQNNEDSSGEQCLAQLAQQWEMALESLLGFGTQLLQQMREQFIIAGTRQ